MDVRYGLFFPVVCCRFSFLIGFRLTLLPLSNPESRKLFTLAPIESHLLNDSTGVRCAKFQSLAAVNADLRRSFRLCSPCLCFWLFYPESTTTISSVYLVGRQCVRYMPCTAKVFAWMINSLHRGPSPMQKTQLIC